MRACVSCGEVHPAILKKLDAHHIFGKMYSGETILLCPNCHAKITYEQNKISPKKRKGATKKDALLFALRTCGATIQVIGEHQIKINEKLSELK